HWPNCTDAYAYSNTNCNRNSDGNSHANSDPKSNAYAHPMHGEMYANAAAAPYSGPPPGTFIRLVRFRNIAGIADENRALSASRTEVTLPFFEVARVFVRFNHVAGIIVNANYSLM